MGRERHRRPRRRLPGLARNRRRSLTFAFLDASVARREVGAAATRGDGAAARGGGQRCRVAVSAGAPRRPGARERPVCIGGGRFRGRERGRRANSTGARVRPLPVGGSPRRPLLHRRGDGESVPVRVCQDGDTRTCQDGGTLAPGAAPSDARMPRASQGPRRIGGGEESNLRSPATTSSRNEPQRCCRTPPVAKPWALPSPPTPPAAGSGPSLAHGPPPAPSALQRAAARMMMPPPTPGEPRAPNRGMRRHPIRPRSCDRDRCDAAHRTPQAPLHGRPRRRFDVRFPRG